MIYPTQMEEFDLLFAFFAFVNRYKTVAYVLSNNFHVKLTVCFLNQHDSEKCFFNHKTGGWGWNRTAAGKAA